jgi:hypothetical protein
LLPATGGEPEQLTKPPLGAGAPVCSPDGTKLAFGPRGHGRRGRRGPQTAGQSAGGHRPDRLPADGTGLLRTTCRQLCTKKNCRQVTERNWHADAARSPDVAKTWTVLLLNPRTSDGYGEELFNAALSGWGVPDAKDLLEPIDELVAKGIADVKRLAVAGYSYGGFMTCNLTSRDNRFVAAAVAGGVISDLTSMAGTSDDGHYLSMLELGGPP